MNIIERFERFFSKDGECWEWRGRLEGGYGRIMLNGKRYKAHRYAYILYVGEIPDGLCVCHKCDNTRCVNPAHLFLGTQAENIADMDSKGRRVPPAGERNRASKLNRDIVMSIFLSSKSASELSKEHGVSANMIYLIKAKKSWRHLHQ